MENDALTLMESRTRVGDYAQLDFDATFTELQHFTDWTLSCYSPGGVYPNVLCIIFLQ
jgi:hypothetical protein